ncbi:MULTISPECIES: CYTH domain-containing protein [Thalassotalea]|uniref:CYTH domain-containing protein n=1 Tax=Thalassotalea castellviae TaxID=3075612 RepID=A0ABU3A1E3_9GAMM|nr:CYTH domain-containing protein [Thalassotalea sp. W431]MDT0603605.1 CYTH domain-containing protein [Thalassotalea sp. W431]
MATEVELKYLTNSDDVSAKIFNLLTENALTYTHQVKQLSNCYFDTPELALRHLDMGLRIRVCGSQIEQTIKTAGIVVGGLHQRPEYNVDISAPYPDLTLFPTEIWPNSKTAQQLQTQIIPLFNTDFTREIWLITMENSVIELAFDQGEISSQGRSLEICELELELVSGEREGLFSLAECLFKSLSLRPGTQSKAARGYRLYFNKQQVEDVELELDLHSNADNIETCFIDGIRHCLQLTQVTIEQYLNDKRLHKLAELVDVLALLRQGFWLFDEKLSKQSLAIRQELSYFIQLFAWVDSAIYFRELMTKTGNYRKKLDYSEQLIEQLKLEKRRFPDKVMVSQLLHSERFNGLLLSLLRMITCQNRQQYFTNTTQEPLIPFAKQKLSESLALLNTEMATLTSMDAEKYLSQRKRLHRSLLTGNWFGSFFDAKQRSEYRMPLQDIQLGLRELQSLWIIKQQLEKAEIVNEANNKKILDWQESKVENLLIALTHSKNLALSLPAYWLT